MTNDMFKVKPECLSFISEASRFRVVTKDLWVHRELTGHFGVYTRENGEFQRLFILDDKNPITQAIQNFWMVKDWFTNFDEEKTND